MVDAFSLHQPFSTSCCSKIPNQLDDTDRTHTTPPPPNKRYEIMKDPVFLSSPIYPPFIPSKPSLSTNRDDHLIHSFLMII